jgi:hypothetical protein
LTLPAPLGFPAAESEPHAASAMHAGPQAITPNTTVQVWAHYHGTLPWLVTCLEQVLPSCIPFACKCVPCCCLVDRTFSLCTTATQLITAADRVGHGWEAQVCRSFIHCCTIADVDSLLIPVLFDLSPAFHRHY